MTGYIKINATDYEGNPAVSVETHLSEIGLMDKVILLDGFLQGIKVKPDDVEMVAMLLAMRDMIYKSDEAKVIKVEMPNFRKDGEDN